MRIAAAGALALLAGGCTPDPLRLVAAPQAPVAGRVERERQLNAQWQEHSMRELVDDWGPPPHMLDIPGGGNPPGFVLVYRRDAASGCLDTFAVTVGKDLRVRSYQCR